MLFHKVIILFLVLSKCCPCIGQPPAYTVIPPEYELEHIKLNSKEGIGLLTDITEDENGYLLLCGTKGLHIFDGNNTVTYHNNSNQFKLVNDSAAEQLTYFTKTNTHRIWIQEHQTRMMLFDPVKRKVLESFTNNTVNNELIDVFPSYYNNTLYFSTRNVNANTLSVWQKKTGSNPSLIYKTNNLDDIIFYQLVGKHHWVIEKNKLIKISLDGKDVEYYEIGTPFLKHFSPSDDADKFYFTDLKQNAIYSHNEQQNKIETILTLPDFLKGKGPYFTIIGNTVYFGNNLSLYIIDKEKKTIQNLSPAFMELAKKETPGSLGVEFVKYVKRKDGTILVCTQMEVYRLKKKVPATTQFLQKINAANSVSPVVSCRAIAEDENKNLYVSYYTGIVKQAGNSNKYTDMPVQPYMAGVPLATYSLQYWKNNLLWNNVRINLANNKLTYMFGDKYGGHVTQFLQNDTLWMFQWRTRNLHCYDLAGNKSATYLIDKNINTDFDYIAEMNDMTGDATGQNLWVSTTNNGILLITKKGKLIKQFLKNDLTISDNKITDLELQGDSLWFGCAEGLGVLHIPSGKTVIYKNPLTLTNNTLQNRVIFSILKDGTGNFYLGSSHGLLWFNVREKKFYNLVDDHPLAKIEYNRASAFKASNGAYYFGSTDGLFSFKANELQFFKAADTTLSIKLYNAAQYNSKKGRYEYASENLDSLSKWVLQPYHNSVEFSFSVPEFYKKIYYSYRIQGQNNTWTDYKTDNKIVIYGLAPGNYTLEVKASSNLSDENASFYTLPIEVKQVWYKKPWIIALFVLVGMAAVIGFIRFRFNQKVQRQKDLAALRTKISSDLHDDVGTILSGLAMQSQMLTFNAKDEQKQSLHEISTMSRDAMEKMRDTVWAMDSRKDKYENLVDRMRDFAEKNLPLRKITHDFIMENVEGKKFINPEKRQAIYLIFKEAITNILKHSDGKHVAIHFTEEKNKTILRIKDNGSEKEKSNSDGLGMSNMKMRAEKLNGILTAKYENGFTVELTI